MRLLPHGCSSAPSTTRSLLPQPVFLLLISSDLEPRRSSADEQSFSLVFLHNDPSKESEEDQDIAVR